eukprot:m.19799 g.19799  ORF g.19799 m.19799 type:complete len:634 (-) comp12617_c0_seq1:235-2136(-)
MVFDIYGFRASNLHLQKLDSGILGCTGFRSYLVQAIKPESTSSIRVIINMNSNMNMFFAIVLLSATLVHANPTRVHVEHDVQVMEQGISASESPHWSKTGRCPAETEVHLVVMLQKSASQLQRLEEVFWAVSDTVSPKYGAHVTAQTLTEMVGASDEDVNTVSQWLISGGASIQVAAMKDSIEATVSCSEAEALFNTELHAFTSARHTLYRASRSYSVPVSIAALVSMVSDLVTLPRAKNVFSQVVDVKGGEGAFPPALSCNDKCGRGTFVTPAVLTQAYSLGDSPQTAKGSMAVAEFQGVNWDSQDLATFSSTCAIVPAVNVTHQIGPDAPAECRIPIIGTACAEAMLDIEYIGSLGGAIPLTDIYSKQFSLLNWATGVMNMPQGTMPLVHSVSYGNDEAQQVSKAYMLECNTQFMKFGALGLSVLFAAGDQGVEGREGPGKVFHPDFPAASPYITAVGGTDFVTKSVIGPEKVWSQGGGGFSDTFPMPDFQQDAVRNYISVAASTLPPQSKWNASGRAYPDVSALGGEVNPYCVHVGGMFSGVAGTSASCPVAAAVFAKLNEVRLAAGGRPLGFLNPWIYKNASTGFNDVKQGVNCGAAVCKEGSGFTATVGWDAATGWGTPNFAKLKTMV